MAINVKKNRGKPAFLIIGICLVLAIASAYANYNTMLEGDFLAPGAKFEAEDIADFFVDKHMKVVFVPSESFVIGSPETDLPGFPYLSSFFQMSSISSSFSILRC